MYKVLVNGSGVEKLTAPSRQASLGLDGSVARRPAVRMPAGPRRRHSCSLVSAVPENGYEIKNYTLRSRVYV